MDALDIGLIATIAIVVLVYAGLYIPIVLIIVSFAGVWLVRQDPIVAANLLSNAAWDSIADYVFGVIPLFVFMGLLMTAADVGRDAFAVANRGFRRLPGGVGVATVSANAMFAAITGISVASAAVFTRIAVPEMLRLGYHPRLAVGIVAGSSILGMLIPPSLLLIVFAVLAQQSVGDMFLAGLVPGLLLVAVYSLGIIALAIFRPATTGGSQVSAGDKAFSTGELISKLGPAALLIMLVIGGIYGGVFTATEAAAVGAFTALLIATAKRQMNWRKLFNLLVETGSITAGICLMLIGASLFSRMLAVSGISGELQTWVTSTEVGLIGLMISFLIIAILLGTMLDAVSTLLITVPIFLPLVSAAGGDIIWFGIVAVIAAEVGLLTPPIGLSCFVIKSSLSSDTPVQLTDIFIGAAPFALMMLAVIAALIAMPGIVTVLL